MDVKRIVWGLSLYALLLTAAAPARAAHEFVYVHDRGAPNQVFAYQLATNGALASVPGSPFQTSAGNTSGVFCQGNCQTAAYSAKLKLLFVTGTAGISVLSVGTNGALTEVEGSPFGPAGDYVGVTLYQKGRATFVYATLPSEDRIRGFSVGSTGALTEVAGSPVAVDDLPVTVAAVKGKLFTIAQGNRLLVDYKIAKSGGLTRAASAAVGTTGAYTFNVDPKGKSVYVPENVAGDAMLAFKVAGSGAFSAVPGSPFGSDVNTGAGLVFGKPFLFALSFSTTVGQDLQVYRRASNGTLSKVSAQSSGLAGPRTGAVRTNRLILVSDNGDSVRTYLVGKDGSLTIADTEAASVLHANGVLILTR